MINWNKIFRTYERDELLDDYTNTNTFRKVLEHYFKCVQYKATTKNLSPIEWLSKTENVEKAITDIKRNQQARVLNGKPQFFKLDVELEQNLQKYVEMYLSSTSDGHKVSNFNPKNATKIILEYTKPNDVVLDFSSGYGVRMLATCKLGRQYIGIEPHKELVEQLEKCKNELGLNATIHCCGSENKILGENSVDFAFTSPPYYNLEIYEKNPLQSTHNRTYQEWLDDYVKPTLQNVFYYLKNGGKCVINIKNLINKGKQPLFDDWLRIAKEIGFQHLETKEIEHNKRQQLTTTNYTQFREPIMILVKP